MPGPTTGFAPVGVVLQPTMLSTVILMSPGGSRARSRLNLVDERLHKSDHGDTVRTSSGKLRCVSMIGIVTTELLVVTTFPFCGPLWARN